MKYLVHWQENPRQDAPSPLIAHHSDGRAIAPSKLQFAPPNGSPGSVREGYPNPETDEICWLVLSTTGSVYFAYPLRPQSVHVPGYLVEGVLITPPSTRDIVTARYEGSKLVITVQFVPDTDAE